MRRCTRRSFLRTGAAAAPLAMQVAGEPLNLPIGLQAYAIRAQLGMDFAGTLKQMKALGYRSLEMCSPPGYATAGFGALAGMPAAEMKRTIQAAGLKCESCHYSSKELKESLAERIAFARELGLMQMVLSSFDLPPGAAMSDWMRSADELNRTGETTLKAGLQLVFHNHNAEFRTLGGELIFDALMRRLDARLVKMQFQVAVVGLGYEPVRFFAKYPGRFISMHLADWSNARKRTVAVGSGDVDWAGLFGSAKAAGVKNYFVEVDHDDLKPSCAFLKALKV